MREVTLKLSRDASDYEEAIDEALNTNPQCDECGGMARRNSNHDRANAFGGAKGCS